ncbi:tetratricopeptide repeat protein [Phenylobacterium sp.]|uniref:O-linked N-acetylglucosamine transferase, SPINDLY family protein n=1 Tax=Phenylobacterium sp. TaxID=1871053 RepID=UPI0035B238E7
MGKAELLGAAGRHLAAGRLDDATAAYREALDLDPRDPNVAADLGALLRRGGRAAEALATYDAALAHSPAASILLTNRANLLNDLRRWAEALASAERALAVEPGREMAHNARGNALLGLGRAAEALIAYERAGALGVLNAAQANLALGRPADALRCAEQAAAARPSEAKPHLTRGHALAAMGRWREAVGAYDEAFRLAPAERFLAGHRLHARMRACLWDGFEAHVADLAARIDRGELATPPFVLASVPVSADAQRRYAEAYIAETSGARRVRPERRPGRRIHVAYFSADLHEHATAYLMAELFELHDRERFEVTAFSYGPETGDPMRTRLKAAFDRFYDVRDLGDAEIAEMARGLGVDIAVDLKGLTADTRPEIFAHGAAPVQVNYLGYPMTMGAAFIDYIIGDPTLIPPDGEACYAEQVVRMPHCYQPNDRRRAVGPPTTREDHGLPGDALVFASFNGAYKITPDVFELWMRLLREFPSAVMWLLEDGIDVAASLRREASARGVDPGRLVFAPKRPQPVHQERIRHADLFLDTFPYTAHTTASDALWAGLPIVTRAGQTFASRVAASLLRASGLEELVATDVDGYLERARRLSADPAALRALRARVERVRDTSPVFDTPAYVADLERLYAGMVGRA